MGKPNPRKGNGHRRRQALARVRASGSPCWICGLPIDAALPAGNPEACEADEVVPVSKGGSPYAPSNIRAAHRCCNNWRRDRSEAYVLAVRRALLASAQAWATPQEFVALAKRLETQGRALADRSCMGFIINTTTDW